MTSKIPSSTIETRDLDIKPLPCLPPQRRQHRISMKPPSFIPLDLTLQDAFYSKPRNTSPFRSVQPARSVRVVKSPPFRPLNDSFKSAEVTSQKRTPKTLSGATKFDALLGKKIGQENQRPTSVSSGIHRNAGRLQKIIRPSSAVTKINKTFDLSASPIELAGTAPRYGAAQVRGRPIKPSKPKRSHKNSRGENGHKSVPRKPKAAAVSSSATGERWELLSLESVRHSLC
jgi:hypothetical protein